MSNQMMPGIEKMLGELSENLCVSAVKKERTPS